MKMEFSKLQKMLFSSSTDSNDPLVKVEKFENLTLIGINRPSKRNCVNHKTAVVLKQHFEDFNQDDSTDAAVLYGEGGNFCAGYDLLELSEGGTVVDENETAKMGDEFRPMGPTKMAFKKPVIAAVEGFAVAGGLELALMCDLRVADETAVFGVFCRRFGVPLLDGGTFRLPKLIGLSRAMDMILTGRDIPAKTAHDWGLVNRLVATGSAVGQAISLAQTICKYPKECMLADRRSAYYGAHEAASFQDAMDFEWRHGLPVVAQESVKGDQKFLSGFGKHGSFNLMKPAKSKSKL